MNNQERKEYWRNGLYSLGYDELIKRGINVPSSLFRFRAGKEKVLETGGFRDVEELYENQVWICEASQFNDPFDSMTEMGGSVLKCKMNRIYCTSFTEDPFDVCMWSHYANYHKGFCLEYSFEELLEFGKNLRPVIYSNDSKETLNLGVSFDYIKSENWQNEKEWRYRQLETPTDIVEIGCPGFLENNFPKPKAIYRGCRMENRFLEESIEKYCSEKKIKNHIIIPNEVLKTLEILR